MSVAIVTGASRGLGRALAHALASRGWRLVLDARGRDELEAVGRHLPSAVTIPGDITDSWHRAALASAAERLGGVGLLVNNASTLGAAPLPLLRDYPLDELTATFATNVVAPVALAQLVLPGLRVRGGVIVNVSSDAAVEPYPAWGGYGASKAALDQAGAVLAAEEPAVRVYSLDPGDMRTAMHQQAFPDEDISDRPEPESVVAPFLRLLDDRPASGRYRAGELATVRT